MKKRLLSLLLIVCICAAMTVSAAAAEQTYVFDNTDCFSAQKLRELNTYIGQFVEDYSFRPCFLYVADAEAEGYDSLYDMLKAVYMQNFNDEDGMMFGIDEAANVWDVYVSYGAKPIFSSEDFYAVWSRYTAADTYSDGIYEYVAAVQEILEENRDLSDEATTPQLTERLSDMAGLLSESEAEEISDLLDEVSERLKFDLVIVTTNYLRGKYYADYADQCFLYNDYGFGKTRDGVLLLISQEPDNRTCYIATHGNAINILTDSRCDSMLDEIVDEHLANGEYYEAMAAFANRCDRYLSPMPQSQKTAIAIGVCVLLSLIVAAVYLAVLKGQMKSVRRQTAANSYVVGDLHLTRSSDLFLYRTVTKTVRETSSSHGGGSSTHTTSGSTFGGRGRSF